MDAPPSRPHDRGEREVPRRASRIGVHLPDDRHVPVRVPDLIEAVAADEETFGARGPGMVAVGQALDRIVGAESASFHRRIEHCYTPFDPDRATLTLASESLTVLAARRAELDRMLEYTFDKANYDRLDDAQLTAAMAAASSHGMKIRVAPEKVQSVALHVRGRTEEHRRVRTLRNPIQGEMREVDLYRRLAVVFRMADSEDVNIKLFREIPVADVEALLPHAEAGMTSLDRLKIIGGGMGALGGVAWKAIAVLAQGAVFASGFIWAVIVALLGLSVRSFFGYRRAQYVRTAEMNHNLYYQNVANNAAALDLLVTNIADEEIKEVFLAYALLAADDTGRLRDACVLAQAARDWLSATFTADVAFDVTDALESLDRFGLWQNRRDLRVVSPDAAREALEIHWRERRSEAYHAHAVYERDCLGGRAAGRSRRDSDHLEGLPESPDARVDP